MIAGFLGSPLAVEVVEWMASGDGVVVEEEEGAGEVVTEVVDRFGEHSFEVHIVYERDLVEARAFRESRLSIEGNERFLGLPSSLC